MNVGRLLTIDRSLLAERAGMLSSQHLRALDDGLRLSVSQWLTDRGA